MPVRVLSRRFRTLFLERLRAAFTAGELRFSGGLETLVCSAAFGERLEALRRIEWVVYSKRPFAGPEPVLAYLARYTHRVAIANSRLTRLADSQVSFTWKDYRHHGKTKVMTLSADEFIRRFLLHAVPDGFHRIRHVGFLANSHRTAKLALCRTLLAAPTPEPPPAETYRERHRRLALLLEREISHRHDKRLAARLRYAKLRHQAAVEDVDYRAVRGLDRVLFQKLAAGAWIDAHDNLILCGPTGVGKSWLASALGHRACRDNRSVLYQRVPKLFAELALARADGRHQQLIRGLVSPQLLILDDWGLESLDAGGRHDLLEILEDRYGRRSTIVTSQVPVEHWHQLIAIRPTPTPSWTSLSTTPPASI